MNSPDLLKCIQTLIKKGQLSHAYLIECENQNTIDSLCESISYYFYCNENNYCGKCNDCLTIKNGFNRAIVIGDGVEKIKKSSIKDLISTINIGNVIEDQKKLYFIINGENMGPESSNSLLKTLEEPPKDVYAFIFTKKRDLILPTIKSRCSFFYVADDYEQLEKNELSEIIIKKQKNDLFGFCASLKKEGKKHILAILNDTFKNVILNKHDFLAPAFYECISKVKEEHNLNLFLENLIIKVYEGI